MVICALGVFLASNPRAMQMDRGGETLTGVEWVTGKGFKLSGKAWSSSGLSSLLGLEEENEVEEEACWGSSPQGRRGDRGGAVRRHRSLASSGGAPARWRGFNGGEDGGAPPWLGA